VNFRNLFLQSFKYIKNHAWIQLFSQVYYVNVKKVIFLKKRYANRALIPIVRHALTTVFCAVLNYKILNINYEANLSNNKPNNILILESCK